MASLSLCVKMDSKCLAVFALLCLTRVHTKSMNQGCSLVSCKINPCSSYIAMRQCSNHPDAECRPNYCGGCFAEFWKNGVQLLDCFDITVLG